MIRETLHSNEFEKGQAPVTTMQKLAILADAAKYDASCASSGAATCNSSGIIGNGDYTMEQLVEVARSLREDHQFRGYIHLKTIPEASPELLALAGRYADRLSINVELPTEAGLQQLAPQKDAGNIRAAMGELRWRIEEAKQAKPAKGVKRGPRADLGKLVTELGLLS